MTADEFRASLKALGISQRWLAGRLGVNTATVNRWAQGTLPVPQYAVFALSLVEQLAAKPAHGPANPAVSAS